MVLFPGCKCCGASPNTCCRVLGDRGGGFTTYFAEKVNAATTNQDYPFSSGGPSVSGALNIPDWIFRPNGNKVTGRLLPKTDTTSSAPDFDYSASEVSTVDGGPCLVASVLFSTNTANPSFLVSSRAAIYTWLRLFFDNRGEIYAEFHVTARPGTNTVDRNISAGFLKLAGVTTAGLKPSFILETSLGKVRDRVGYTNVKIDVADWAGPLEVGWTVAYQDELNGPWLSKDFTLAIDWPDLFKTFPADECPEIYFSGACCHPDGSCTEEIESDCVAAGGTWQGKGTDCASAACLPGNPLP